VLASLHVLSEQVFGDSYLEFLGLIVLVSGFATFYRHIECHRSGCHRIGRFLHGHMKLCALHHPLVPDDGKITDREIAAVKLPSEHHDQPPARAQAGRAPAPAPPPS